MIKALIRLLALTFLALSVVGVTSGLSSPAQAAAEADAPAGAWVERYSDHTDIVVDWFAVPDAASDPAQSWDICVQATNEVLGSVWLLEKIVCANFVYDCATVANSTPRFVGHPIRVGFYSSEKRCSVIGVP